MKRELKAQTWSIDFIVSIIIFFLVLSLIFFFWNYKSSQNIEQSILTEIETSALEFSDSLVRTKGLPEDWNSTSVIKLGLASEENILDQTKVQAFNNSLSYSQVKDIFKSYDFYIKITDLNGTVYAEKGNVLVNKTSVPVERYSILNKKIVKMLFVLYGE
jgi:hypothetical protein